MYAMGRFIRFVLAVPSVYIIFARDSLPTKAAYLCFNAHAASILLKLAIINGSRLIGIILNASSGLAGTSLAKSGL